MTMFEDGCVFLNDCMSGPEGGVARTETRVWQPGPLARLAQAVAHGRSWRARASNGQPGSGSGPGASLGSAWLLRLRCERSQPGSLPPALLPTSVTS